MTRCKSCLLLADEVARTVSEHAKLKAEYERLKLHFEKLRGSIEWRERTPPPGEWTKPGWRR